MPLAPSKPISDAVTSSFVEYQRRCESKYRAEVAERLLAEKEKLEAEIGEEIPLELPQVWPHMPPPPRPTQPRQPTPRPHPNPNPNPNPDPSPSPDPKPHNHANHATTAALTPSRARDRRAARPRLCSCYIPSVSSQRG